MKEKMSVSFVAESEHESLRIINLSGEESLLWPKDGEKCVIIPVGGMPAPDGVDHRKEISDDEYDNLLRRACEIARRFKEAGVTVIGFAEKVDEEMDELFDGVCIVPLNYNIRGCQLITDMMTYNPVIPLTEQDFCRTFKDIRRFKILNTQAIGYGNIAEQAVKDLDSDLNQLNPAKGARILISACISSQIIKAYTDQIRETLMGYFNRLSEKYDLIWGFYVDADNSNPMLDLTAVIASPTL